MSSAPGTRRPVVRTVLPAEAGTAAALHARARATYYPDGLPEDGVDWAAAWSGAVERPHRTTTTSPCAAGSGRERPFS